MLNPLFEREFRSRWRPANAFFVLVLPVLLEVAVLYLLIQRFLGMLQSGDATVDQMQALGRELLQGWQRGGGLILVPVALCIGATSILHEKDTGTLEQVLLSPLEPRGVVLGKLLSGALYLLIFQIVLLPVLQIAGSIVLLPPGPFYLRAFLHFLLTFQALALGICAAIRAKTIAESLGVAIAAWLVGVVSCAFMLGCGLTLFQLVGIIIRAMFSWSWPLAAINFVFPYIIDFVGGAFGCFFLFNSRFTQSAPHILFAVLGQSAMIFFMLRWAALQLNHPEHLLSFANIRPLLPILLSGRERLTPAETAFMAHQRAEIAKNFALQSVETVAAANPPAKKERKNTNRLRLLPTRWLQNLNPVFWLDLQRCLSLRAPSPEAQVPLLLFIALGGSIIFALGMATIISLFQTLLTGSKADLAYLSRSFQSFRIILCYVALLTGPLFGTMGFVIERRSKMLHELRLTLLTARDMWWGKFGSRFIIPVIGCVPSLAVIGFFADNMPGHGLWMTVLEAALMILLVAASSILGCLVLSFHSRSQLMAAMWCLGMAVVTGSMIWPLGSRMHPWLAALSPKRAVLESQWLMPFLMVYAVVAAVLGIYIWWRLRREGFA